MGVTEPQATLASTAVPEGAPLRLAVEVAGAKEPGKAAYRWQRDGTLLTGETGPVLDRPAATTDDAGIYLVTVEVDGQTASCTAVVAVLSGADTVAWPSVWDGKYAIWVAAVLAVLLGVLLLLVGAGVETVYSGPATTESAKLGLSVGGVILLGSLGTLLLLGALWVALVDARLRARSKPDHADHLPVQAGPVVQAFSLRSLVLILMVGGLACLGLGVALGWRVLP